jgi:hypothetical protein
MASSHRSRLAKKDFAARSFTGAKLTTPSKKEMAASSAASPIFKFGVN